MDLIARGAWLLQLLEDLSAVFPLAECGIPNFKGAHHITLAPEPDMITLGIWWKGQCRPYHCTLDEFDKTDMTVLLKEIRAEIDYDCRES